MNGITSNSTIVNSSGNNDDTITLNQPTKSGYKFVEWNTEPDGNETTPFRFIVATLSNMYIKLGSYYEE
ncbi:MAG: InlB B-repeat-containing protein [Bacilli bacterium]|nr:InlB B-repeat-containing protein [Bacilli bacterium]